MLHRASSLPDPKLPAWANAAAAHLIGDVLDPAFPCTFARRTVTGDTLHFAFAELASEQANGWPASTAALDAWAELDRISDPYRVLALCFDACGDWAADDAAMWALLRHLAAADPEANAHAGSGGWTLVYRGLPWFFNLNGPSGRRSRNATGGLSILIQRTDSFDGLAPEHQHDAVRASIRARLDRWDGLGASPLLAGNAGNPDGVEWRQFHLPPDNTTPAPARCPFHD